MDERPPVWVGHVRSYATDLRRTTAWWASLGLRLIEQDDDIAIFELRGGTHLLVFPVDDAPAPGTDVGFDLMVDDIDATHADWERRGLQPSDFGTRPGNHRVFSVQDPDGAVLRVYNSHVTGPV